MKAKYGNQIVDVWEIGQATPKPSWVEEAFQKNYMVWLDNHVRILMAGLNTSLATKYQVWSSWKQLEEDSLVMECMFLVIQVII